MLSDICILLHCFICISEVAYIEVILVFIIITLAVLRNDWDENLCATLMCCQRLFHRLLHWLGDDFVRLEHNCRSSLHCCWSWFLCFNDRRSRACLRWLCREREVSKDVTVFAACLLTGFCAKNESLLVRDAPSFPTRLLRERSMAFFSSFTRSSSSFFYLFSLEINPARSLIVC